MLQQNTFNTQQYEEKTYNCIAVENVPFACVLCCAVCTHLYRSCCYFILLILAHASNRRQRDGSISSNTTTIWLVGGLLYTVKQQCQQEKESHLLSEKKENTKPTKQTKVKKETFNASNFFCLFLRSSFFPPRFVTYFFK